MNTRSSMSDPHPPLLARAGVAMAYGIALMAGAHYGFGFGVQIGGLPMGVLTGGVCALFCTILVSGGVDTLRQRLGRRH